jgi:diguanylate cyclase (GGDEF)-like protein/PAS domain S-box-containing protein
MGKKAVTSSKAVELRRQMEARSGRHGMRKSSHPSSASETQRLLHHLAMQNEELTRSRAEFAAAYRQFTDLYDFAPVGFFILGRDGTILNSNLTGANLLGVEPSDLIKRQLEQFLSAESRPSFRTFIEKLSACKGKETCELAFRNNGNGMLWAHLEATCFEGGQECRTVVTDITERKLAAQALQESENRFRTILQDVPTIAVQGYAADGTTQYWNSASEKLYGYSAQEAIGQNLLDLIIPPEMRSDVRQAVQQMAATGHPIPASELSLMRKDGSRVTVYSSHSIVSIPGGAPELFCLDVDLTERKQAENALRESEWRNKIVSDLITDYVFVVDVCPDGSFKLRWASESMQRMTGRTLESAATSEMWKKIIHPDDLKRFFGFANHILATLRAGEIECRSFTLDGTEHWNRIFAQPLCDESNAVTTIVGAVKDITARKKAEEDMRLARESAEAANRALQQALEREMVYARTDSLTEVFNRRYFFEIANHEFEVAKRYQRPLSIIMFDIDNFKQFNDTYGHQAGDELLRDVAQTAQQQLREADILARYGGDEFVILLSNSNTQDALQAGERIQESIAAHLSEMKDNRVNITLSMGIAECPKNLDTVDRLVQHADKALYNAKHAGRNRIIVYQDQREKTRL